MEQHGAYQSICFEDPGLHAIVNLWGGWPEVCEKMTYEDLRYRQKEFRMLYERYRELPRDDSYLPGLHESVNRLAGHSEHIQPPVRIGFKGGKLIASTMPERKRIEGHTDAPGDVVGTCHAGRDRMSVG